MTLAKRYCVALLWLCIFVPAYAALRVEDKIVQQGIYLKSGCPPQQSKEEYNSCVCEADIRYPQLSGLVDKAAESSLNASFINDAQSMRCEGKQIDATADKTKYGDDHASSSHHYEVTFQSENILGLSFSDSIYTGGIQDDTKIYGMIINLAKGNVFTIADLFSKEGLQAANTFIYDTLIAKPEGEVRHDEVEKRKGAFITEKECNGCTLIAQKDGMHVQFKAYEISPSIASQIEVVLPFKLLRNPELFAANASATAKPAP